MKALGILSILLLGFTITHSSGSREASEVLARVGESEITSTDVSYKIAIEEAYGNKTVTDTVALVALVNNALEREVGMLWGVAATHEEIDVLSKHADETTKAPEILTRVKHTFGDDRVAYGRIYLAPQIINRKLRIWYSRNMEIHARERSLIEKAYYLVRSGKSLEEAAKACGLPFSTIEYRKGDREIPALLKEYFPQGSESSDDPMIAILQTLTEGEICKNIVEDDYGYNVIRLVRKDRSQYTVEVITAQKRPFMQWFLAQAAKVQVKILDVKLHRRIALKYPNVWWVREWCKTGDSVGK